MAEPDLIDQLEQVFRVVIQKARTDAAFARQMAEAIGGGQLPSAAPKRQPRDRVAPEVEIAPGLSADEIRSLLRPLTRDAIYALVRKKEISPVGTSSFNKTQLVEHVVRHQSRHAEGPRRNLDY